MGDAAPCTFGRKTEIPGMAKFSEHAKVQVWCETVTKEMKSWCALSARSGSSAGAERLRCVLGRSDGMKKNPPNKEFKILRPQKMEPLDLKSPMAARAVDEVKERRARLAAMEASPVFSPVRPRRPSQPRPARPS